MQPPARVLVCETTKHYRSAALLYAHPDDVILEVGCHEGTAGGSCASLQPNAALPQLFLLKFNPACVQSAILLAVDSLYAVGCHQLQLQIRVCGARHSMLSIGHHTILCLQC